LLAWFAANARALPWRGTRDLYAIWISEIMLQQTQVVTVVDYFQRFLRRFPTLNELAAADEQEVLRMWEGLGYYRRARQLHAAAKQIVTIHGGVFPESFREVLSLPGIGRYTAGAILSIGRDQRLPILEANTIRVLSRLLAFAGDPHSAAGQQTLWRFAEEILPAREVGHFNQALMELGATLCTPREPSCLDCPLKGLCPTRKAGQTHRIPAPKRKTAYEDVSEAAVVIRRRDGHVLVRQCQPGERWAGLWDFPRVAMTNGDESKQLCAAIQMLTSLRIELGEQFAVIKHGVTRYRITLRCYEARAKSSRLAKHDDNRRWIAPESLHELPLSTTGRKISKLIGNG
jgi:A/G-specific adenine glycosylase